jgi:hypothetical protein
LKAVLKGGGGGLWEQWEEEEAEMGLLDSGVDHGSGVGSDDQEIGGHEIGGQEVGQEGRVKKVGGEREDSKDGNLGKDGAYDGSQHTHTGGKSPPRSAAMKEIFSARGKSLGDEYSENSRSLPDMKMHNTNIYNVKSHNGSPYGKAKQAYSNQPYPNQPYSNQPYSNQPYSNQQSTHFQDDLNYHDNISTSASSSASHSASHSASTAMNYNYNRSSGRNMTLSPSAIGRTAFSQYNYADTNQVSPRDLREITVIASDNGGTLKFLILSETILNSKY